MAENRLLDTTKKNMKRNYFLSISTILVSSIVMIISSFFISVGIIAQKTVDYYEKRAQVIIFFKRDTKESDILLLKDKIYNPDLIESIEYISQEKALAIYRDDFSDNPELLSTVTSDSLPPSLEIRAKSVESLLSIIEKINIEKEKNTSIDEVMYFKDVVNTLKSLSGTIKISSIILISALILIAFTLIRITIGFNINSHKEEIKVMHLVGSPSKFIKLPYIFEGLFYGGIGGFIAATIIIIPTYILISYLTKSSDFAFWFNQVLRDLGLGFIKPVNFIFLPLYYLVHIFVGALIGIVSSLSAVKKYLD